MKAVGVTDEVQICDCCGKSNLKKTVMMQTEDGDILYYGTTCASRNSGKTKTQINSEIRAEEKRKQKLARAEVMESKEYKTYARKIRELATKDIEPGKASRNHVRAASRALEAVERTVAAKYGLKYINVS